MAWRWCETCKLGVLALTGCLAVPAVAIPPEAASAIYDRRILSSTATVQEVPSTEAQVGVAAGGGFDSFNVNLLSQVPISEFFGDSTSGNDVWGYVSPSGREYAIVGMDRSTGFVDVTDPLNPVVVGDIPNESGSCTWDDMAVWGNHCYAVTDCSGAAGNLQTIDLSDIELGAITHVHTLSENGFSRAHNVFVNPDSGYAYLCGANAPTSGLIALSLADPAAPTMVGIWTDHYVHDVYVMNYPDCPYSGRSGPCEIAFAFGAGAGNSIIDVTDKFAMATITNFAHPNLSISHQGWITEDHKHLLIGDEGDESSFGIPTTTYIYNVEDLENPTFVTSFTNGLPSIDHNMMVRGDYVFQANYSSGLRIWDLSNINAPVEVGYFDTFPSNDFTSFAGAWGVYTNLPSGVVLVSNDTSAGLFVLDATPAVGCQQDSHCNDGNACTDDVCDVDAVCQHIDRAPGVACDDGDICTFGGQCNAAAVCISTDYNTVSCVNDDPCGPGLCDLDAGLCFCAPCVSVARVLNEPQVFPKNRFLSIVPTNPGIETAIRVVLSELPPQFADKVGMEMWVGAPTEYCENAGTDQAPPGACPPAPGRPSRTFKAAPLVANPVFRDWGDDGQIELFGPAVVPGATYTVQEISIGCFVADILSFSPSTVVKTSVYGDMVEDCASIPCPPPNGVVEITDVLALLLKFQNLPTAPTKARMEIGPNAPDMIIGIGDAVQVLFAFTQSDYPFEGP